MSILIQSAEENRLVPSIRELARWIVSELNPVAADNVANRADNLTRIITIAARPQVQPRAMPIASAVGICPTSPFAALTFLPAAAEPPPCRLETQDLVEMLKFPTCVGEVRRVILDQLGNRYGQHFTTHWNFVRYAKAHNLKLDFNSPPTRPDPKLPHLFED